MTGGRIKRIKRDLDDEPFLLTYGDGLCDVDVEAELEFHRSHGKLATMMAVHPDSRFGVLEIKNDQIQAFREKSEADAGWINGGFMVLDPKVVDYIDGDSTVFEREPLEALTREGQLMAFRHRGFWHCMDTMRDKEKLEALWSEGKAPWKRWEA
jgi:glucose-1-phosphate cytidylyltransferase